MSLNAYNTDFWIGRIFISKDSRETWRHVAISEMRGGRAKCHTLLYRDEDGQVKMNKRGSWISFKSLATRWQGNGRCRCLLCVAPTTEPEQKGRVGDE